MARDSGLREVYGRGPGPQPCRCPGSSPGAHNKHGDGRLRSTSRDPQRPAPCGPARAGPLLWLRRTRWAQVGAAAPSRGRGGAGRPLHPPPPRPSASATGHGVEGRLRPGRGGAKHTSALCLGPSPPVSAFPVTFRFSLPSWHRLSRRHRLTRRLSWESRAADYRRAVKCTK